MARGKTSRIMAMFGFPTTWVRTGRLTVTALGTTFLPGAGVGLAMSRGALRLTTTAAGTILAATGAGARDRSTRGPSMARRSSASLAAALALVWDSASALAVVLAGSRSAGVSRSIRGITA